MTRLVRLGLFMMLPTPMVAQEWSCTAPEPSGGVHYSCDSGKGSWVIVWDNGKAQGGCMKGRDVALFTPISTQAKNSPMGVVIAQLTRNREVEVKLLGDSEKPITFSTAPRPLQHVLLDLQRETGVPIEAPWLPQIGAAATFSVCINARAMDAGMLIHAVTGTPVDVPREKWEVRVSLKMRNVIASQVRKELLDSLGKEAAKK